MSSTGAPIEYRSHFGSRYHIWSMRLARPFCLLLLGLATLRSAACVGYGRPPGSGLLEDYPPSRAWPASRAWPPSRGPVPSWVPAIIFYCPGDLAKKCSSAGGRPGGRPRFAPSYFIRGFQAARATRFLVNFVKKGRSWSSNSNSNSEPNSRFTKDI